MQAGTPDQRQRPRRVGWAWWAAAAILVWVTGGVEFSPRVSAAVAAPAPPALAVNQQMVPAQMQSDALTVSPPPVLAGSTPQQLVAGLKPHPSLNSRFGTVYDLGGSAHVAQISPMPVNYQDASGACYGGNVQGGSGIELLTENRLRLLSSEPLGS